MLRATVTWKMGWIHWLARPGAGLSLKAGWRQPYLTTWAQRGHSLKKGKLVLSREKPHRPIQETTERGKGGAGIRDICNTVNKKKN